MDINSTSVHLNEVKHEERIRYMAYLLMADESEEVITLYIDEGELYAIHNEGEFIGVILFIFESSEVVEIKNMALIPEARGKGLGKEVIKKAFHLFREKQYKFMSVGTANSSIANLAFYQKAGFRMTDIKKDFFKKYPEPIFEDGIRALDMVMFSKEL
ncbi:GNAT family N-acetyltransferase [Peribacillus alkalitolerans]|uniref:GNAT family N-acetyltransferase n=1 Tax=Peribacillus alkalitolerans TaxID=1550385 RepID=UPI0013D1E686|nr:GNAT family N-acetyltransferase [Peribacillus alkalitolerans]